MKRDFEKTEKFLRDKFERTDRKILQFNQSRVKTEKFLNKLGKQIGGIANSSGDVAENYFYQNFCSNKFVHGVEYDHVDKNRIRGIGNLKVEYDIMLINSDKILITEVKYNLKKINIKKIYKKLPNFRVLFPEYKNYSVFGAVAGMSFENGAEKTAKNKGLLFFNQSGKDVKKLSPDNLKLSEF